MGEKKLVGLTGGIGSGKSLVARQLSALGADVIDADQLAREVVDRGTPGLSAVVDRFGQEVLDETGSLDRRKVGRIVFTDEAALQDLNDIVHPLVSQRADELIAQSTAPVVVYDVPLLFENGLEKGFSTVVVVSVSPATQRERIRTRDRLSKEEIESRIAAQLPLSEKEARADFVIDNNGDVDATRAQVEALFESLVGLHGN